MVVSTTQVDDWDESSSFLMERLLQALPLSGADLMSAGRSGVSVDAPRSSPGTDTGRLPTLDVAGRHCLPAATRSPRPARWELSCAGSDKLKRHPVLARVKLLKEAGPWGGGGRDRDVGPQPALLLVWPAFRPSVPGSSDIVRDTGNPHIHAKALI